VAFAVAVVLGNGCAGGTNVVQALPVASAHSGTSSASCGRHPGFEVGRWDQLDRGTQDLLQPILHARQIEQPNSNRQIKVGRASGSQPER
jgi:hypothetical protein